MKNSLYIIIGALIVVLFIWYSHLVLLPGIVECELNSGVSFSLLGDFELTPLIVALNLIFVFGFLIWAIKKKDPVNVLGTFMVLCGGIGNFIDRLIDGKVCDYIRVWKFSAFNIPDVLICSGVILICIGLFVRMERETQQ